MYSSIGFDAGADGADDGDLSKYGDDEVDDDDDDVDKVGDAVNVGVVDDNKKF